MKALVGAFNQEKALVGAFSVIVQPVVEPMDRFAALLKIPFYYPLLQDQRTQQNNRGIYHGNESIMVTSGRGLKETGQVAPRK